MRYRVKLNFALEKNYPIPDNNTLVVLISLHVVVGVVGDGEDVRWELPDLLVSVQLDLFGCVDR